MERALLRKQLLYLATLLVPCMAWGQGNALGSTTRSDSIDLLHTRIVLDLTGSSQGTIHGHAHLRFTPLVPGINRLQLDLIPEADSVIMQANQLPFTHANEVLTIALPGAYGPNDTLELSVHYGGQPATDPSGFGGFYLENNYQYNLGVAFTSVPHSYGRAWFPCFDNFVERCSFDLEVRTDTSRTVYANGALLGVVDEGVERMTHWRIDEPIPAYLVSVAAGNYTAMLDTFPSVAGHDVPVVVAALPADTVHVPPSFAHLQEAFNTFEQWYGPYRWNRVGYVLTSKGAMEHATNICFPDFTVDGTLDHEGLIAHELAHSWFGNLITCASPAEMYINEGFADFSSMLFFQAMYGDSAYMQMVRSNHRQVITKTHVVDGGWYALNAVPPDLTYGETTYKKGANVARTLRSVMGDSLFRVGMQRVFNNNAFSPVNSEQLRDSLQAASGVDLSDFFDDWVFQPGATAFRVDSFAVEPAGAGYHVQVHTSQRTRGGADLYHHVPVTLSFIGAQGQVQRAVVGLGGAMSTVAVDVDHEPVTVRLNDDDRLALATTWDTATVHTGSKALSQVDVRLVATGLDQPAHFRVEEYWVAADAYGDGGYRVSPDRWWRVEGDAPQQGSITMRIILDGRPGLPSAFDQGLMQDLDGLAFHEDSLVVLYRPHPGSPWAVKPAPVSTLGNPNDRNARVDIPDLMPGDYAVAWRVLPVGVETTPARAHGWRYYPDPATTRLTVVAPEAGQAQGCVLVMTDLSGRSLAHFALHPGTNMLDVSWLARQTVALVLHQRDGGTIGLGRLHLTH